MLRLDIFIVHRDTIWPINYKTDTTYKTALDGDPHIMHSSEWVLPQN